MKNKKFYEKELKEIMDSEGYTLLTEYVNNQTKVKVRHNKCGNEYYVTPNIFKNGKRCPKCNGGIKFSEEEFKKKLKLKTNGRIISLEPYINSQTKILFKCKVCGNTFSKRPQLIFSGHECSYCSNNIKRSTSDFKKEVYEIVKDEYKVIGEYKNNKTPIKMKHMICGHIYKVTPKDFLKKNGNRCPYCNNLQKQSLGERLICKILDKYEVLYETQYKIKNEKTKRYLTMDFKLTEVKTNKPIFIEFDGSLHYRSWNNSERNLKQLERQKLNDKYKDDYCKKNDILLIRIPYWDINNIEEILKEKIEL